MRSVICFKRFPHQFHRHFLSSNFELSTGFLRVDCFQLPSLEFSHPNHQIWQCNAENLQNIHIIASVYANVRVIGTAKSVWMKGAEKGNEQLPWPTICDLSIYPGDPGHFILHELNRIVVPLRQCSLGNCCRPNTKAAVSARLSSSFCHDVTAAILVFQNNEMAAILVFLTNPVGVNLLSYAKNFLCSNRFSWT